MNYTLLICSAFILFSCMNSNTSKSKTKDNNLVFLNLDEALIKDTLHASTFIASVTPVVLETTDENLTGFLSAMQVTKDCICVLDGGPGGSGCLFVFNKQGKYLRKIGEKGQGPGEYINIHDFTISEKNNEVFIVDDKSSKIRVYNFSTGEFVRNIPFEDDKVKYRSIQYIDEKLFTDITYFSQVEEGAMMYALNDATGKIETKYLDVSVHNHGWLKPFSKGESFFYCKNSAHPKYTHYFMDTIMTINNGILEPYLVIKSEDWVTSQNIKSNKNNAEDATEDVFFKIQELPIAFNIQNYVESDNYIYFIYNKQQAYITVVYDKKQKQIYRTKRLIDDILFADGQYGIPLIACGDEYGMYGYINTVSVPDFYEYIVNNRSSAIKPEFGKYFRKTITSDSNPIILYYEYKK